jgi:Fuc2NAc and GlcNAc transferase
VHVLSAAWLLACAFDPLAAFGVGGRVASIAAYCAIALAIVWGLNLYNFMDGIDGLAGSQGVFLGAAGAFLLWRHGLYVPATLMVLAASATLGFLVHNWPPARIFMGDVGSGGIGFLFAAVPVATLGSDGPSIYVWAILWGTFLCDATTTLARRILRGEKLAQAHRGHAYQVLSLRVGSHRTVTQWYSIVNVVWLLPLAIVADSSVQIGRWACAIALAPLCIAAWVIGGGRHSGEG